MRSRLAKLQAFLLSELQIAPEYSILKAFPSIFVGSSPWHVQIALTFLHTLIVVHRVHYNENTDCLLLLRLLPPGINPCLITDVVDILSEVSGISKLSCNSGSIALAPECP